MDHSRTSAPAAPAQGHPGEGLRARLRAATMAAHDLLDASMQAASGWQCRADYARFLALQHAARTPIETWFADHAPPALRPPEQTALIARDLAELGVPLPPPAPAFTLAAPDEGEALGAAWVLAGSALGNRSILKQVERAGAAEAGARWPTAFLADEAMLAFWQDLRRRIEGPAPAHEAAGAAAAAHAVFGHFLAIAESAQAESLGA